MDTNWKELKSNGVKPFVSWLSFILCVVLVLTLALHGVALVVSFGLTDRFEWRDYLEDDFYQTELYRESINDTIADLIGVAAAIDENWINDRGYRDVEFPFIETTTAEQDEIDRVGMYWQDEEGNWFTEDGQYISPEEMIRIAAGVVSQGQATTYPAATMTTAMNATAVTTATTVVIPAPELDPDENAEESVPFGGKIVYTMRGMGSSPGTLYYSANLLNPDFVGSNMADYGVENFEDAVALAESLRNEYRYVYVIQNGETEAWYDGTAVYSPGIQLSHYANASEINLVLMGGHYDLLGSMQSVLWSQQIGDAMKSWYQLRSLLVWMAIGAGALVVLLVPAILLWKHRHTFTLQLKFVLNHIWLEVKLIAIIVLIWCVLLAFDRARYANTFICWILIFGGAIAIGILLWELFTGFPDSCVPGMWRLFRRGVRRLGQGIRDLERLYPFQRAMTVRAWVFLGIIGLLLLLTWLLGISGRYYYNGPIILILLISAAMVVSSIWFYRGYRHMVRGIGDVMDAARDIRAGDIETTLEFSEEHELHELGDDLNHIGEGFHRAVEESFRAERMKVELVTNISHDLKTPLTSIVTYSRLLRDLSLDPPADEYVDVICQKADRLDRLTKDLFEVSRAQSGNLPLNMETIDFAAHVRQSMAELDERIAASGLSFRVRLGDAPVYIRADGSKLYRVIENLVINAVKYAMPGTRVWITLTQDGECVTFEIKNIAAEEMTFDASQIAERFVRGDESRTDGGTGLGLAIARSFTEACGGEFDIDIDGDVFCVTMRFARADEN